MIIGITWATSKPVIGWQYKLDCHLHHYRFVHGGAWRSPSVSSTSFLPTLKTLLDSSSTWPQTSRILGYASINYRLSSYPSHSISPSEPDDPARNVVHPTHIHDVLDALAFLQETYGFGERYIFAGHSAGATLVWHVVMDEWRHTPQDSDGTFPQKEQKPLMPLAIIALAGIYDFIALRDRHLDDPMYRDILQGAFPDGPQTWSAISPTTWLTRNTGRLDKIWSNGRLILVGHSKEDKSVEEEQALDLMHALEVHDGGSGDADDAASTTASALYDAGRKGRRTCELVWLEGDHDAVWEQGKEFATMITTAIDRLSRGEA